MADPRDDDKPQYTLYRARPSFLQPAPQRRRRAARDAGRAARRGATRSRRAPKRRRRWLPGAVAGGISLWRVLRWLITALVAWLAISLVLFLVSAQIQSAQVSDAADAELGGGGYPLTSPNTILVLGSDARTKDSKEPGANKIGTPSRSDSILLVRVGGGHNATLSIPRDTVVNIPGTRPEQDQRRLRDRRPVAGDPHRRGLPRHPGQPPRRGQLRELPAADRRARRRHLPRRLRRQPAQRRLQERRLHAAAEGRRAGDRRQAGARARPHAQERVQPQGVRPHPRPPPAEDHGLDQGQGHEPRDLHPAAVGVLGGAEGDPRPTCPARRCSASSARS